MATILIDAEVYQVDDEEALHKGVAYESFGGGCVEPVWSSGGDNYMEAKTVSEIIKASRFIRRPDGTKIIGLSKDVHEALGWHVEAFDNMEKELNRTREYVENLKSTLSRTESENLGYSLKFDELQSLNLWGRIKYLITGAL